MRDHAAYDAEEAAAIVAGLRHLEGPLLPVLHALQARFGHVPEEAQRLVAEALNLSRAEVYGVVSFYHDFHAAPDARRVLKLCGAEACQAAGGARAAEAVAATLAAADGGDARVKVETVYCLGLCAVAPAAMLDGRLHGRLSGDRARALAGEALL